jgi:hypothetical protein
LVDLADDFVVDLTFFSAETGLGEVVETTRSALCAKVND